MKEGAIRELPCSIGPEEAVGLLAGVAPPVALTGATGFIGSHIVEVLASAGVPLRVLVRDPRRLTAPTGGRVVVVRGDLDDLEALGALVAGAGTVLHLAGRVRAGTSAAFDRANRIGTENLVAVARDAAPGARFVYVSSLAAAGPSAEPAGVLPDDEPQPISAYGRSKLGGEIAVRQVAASWAIVRPPAVYGPRDVDILQFFKLAARGIVPIPAGRRWLTVAYVADVVRGTLRAASGAADRRVVHLGEPRTYEMSELVRELIRAGGLRALVVPTPGFVLRAGGRAGDGLQRLGVRAVALTSDKAREMLARHWTSRTAGSLAMLGIRGCVSFFAGAAETWRWYRAQGWVPRAKITVA